MHRVRRVGEGKAAEGRGRGRGRCRTHWTSNAPNEGRKELGDVPVAIDCKGLSEGNVCGCLHLLLCVSHAVGEAGDNLMEASGNLSGGGLGLTCEDGEGEVLALPVAGLPHGIKEGGQGVPSRVGVQDGKEGLGSLLGSSAGGGRLVGDSLEEVGEEGEEVRLRELAKLLGNGLEGGQASLSVNGGLDLLGEGRKGGWALGLGCSDKGGGSASPVLRGGGGIKLAEKLSDLLDGHL